MSVADDFKHAYDAHVSELTIEGMKVHPRMARWLDPGPQARVLRELIDRVERLEREKADRGPDLFRPLG